MIKFQLRLFIRVFLMVALVVGQRSAQAAQWVHFSTWDDGKLSYLDAKSVIVQGDRRIAWTKVEQAAPTDFNGGSLSGWVARIEVDCRARTQRTLSETGYQPDGSVLYQFREPRDITDVIPDSLGERRLKALCSRDAKTRRK